jgi:predicted transcriptional regulator
MFMLFTTKHLENGLDINIAINPSIITEEFIQDIYQRIEVNPGMVYSEMVQNVIEEYEKNGIAINQMQIQNAVSCLKFTGKVLELV